MEYLEAKESRYDVVLIPTPIDGPIVVSGEMAKVLRQAKVDREGSEQIGKLIRAGRHREDEELRRELALLYLRQL